jgi:VWFA-related protein
MYAKGISPWQRAAMLVPLALAFWTGPAHAAVAVRVEARPVSDPIQVFVHVTDANGRPVGGLKAADFTVLVDGATVASPTFTLPPSQDGSQRVSVVFAMDMSQSVQSTALASMQDAVTAFINAMQPGDYAAVVKFNNTNPAKASVVQPFTAIDGGAGSSALIAAATAPYSGSGSNVLDGIKLSIDQLRAPPTALPAGPKAVVVVTDGRDNASTSTVADVLANANAASIPIFAIGVGDVTASGLKLLQDVTSGTGGTYLPAPTSSQIDAAYAQVRSMLSNEYLLTFPSTISDCGTHSLEVRVTNQAATTTTFTRCTSTGGGGGSGGSGGGGGGGGAIGWPELATGAVLLVIARRRLRDRRTGQSAVSRRES